MKLDSVSVEQILMMVMALNAILTSLHKGLAFLKDKTESKNDDKIYEILSKVLGMLSMVIEFLSANSIGKKK